MPLVQGSTETTGGVPLAGLRVSNGRHIAITDGAGRFALDVEPELHRFLFVTVPDGFTGARWFLPAAAAAHGTAPANLTLEPVRSPSPPSDRLRLGHISDIHLDTSLFGLVSEDMVAADLERLRGLCPDLDVIVATGDLTDVGDVDSLRALSRRLDACPIPVIPVFGGHDGNEEATYLRLPPPNLRHWEQVFGPTYYSLERGPAHIVVWPDEDHFFGPVQAAMKEEWLEADLALVEGKRIVVARHTVPPGDWVERMARRGVELVVCGHWHSSKLYEHAGVTVACTPSFTNGSFDGMARGFRAIELAPGRARPSYIGFVGSRDATAPRPNPRVVWQATLPCTLGRAQPLVVGGSAYLPMAGQSRPGEGGVAALSLADGRIRWLRDDLGSVRGTPAATEGVVVAVTQEGVVHALEAQSGGTLWTRKLAGHPDRWIHTGPVVAGGKVVAGTGSGGMEALEPATGEPSWRWQHPAGQADGWPHHSTALIHGDRLFVMSHRLGVSAISADDGRPAWHFDCRYEYMLAAPMLCAGRLLVPDVDRFHALDPETGALLWMRPTVAGEILNWSCDGDLLVLNAAAGRFYGRNECRLERLKPGVAQFRCARSGAILHELECGPDLADMVPYRRDSNNAVAAPVITPGLVYLAGLDGYVRSVDRADRRETARVDVGAPVVGVAHVHGGSLIAAAYPNSVLRLDMSRC